MSHPSLQSQAQPAVSFPAQQGGQQQAVGSATAAESNRPAASAATPAMQLATAAASLATAAADMAVTSNSMQDAAPHTSAAKTAANDHEAQTLDSKVNAPNIVAVPVLTETTGSVRSNVGAGQNASGLQLTVRDFTGSAEAVPIEVDSQGNANAAAADVTDHQQGGSQTVNKQPPQQQTLLPKAGKSISETLEEQRPIAVEPEHQKAPLDPPGPQGGTPLMQAQPDAAQSPAAKPAEVHADDEPSEADADEDTVHSQTPASEGPQESPAAADNAVHSSDLSKQKSLQLQTADKVADITSIAPAPKSSVSQSSSDSVADQATPEDETATAMDTEADPTSQTSPKAANVEGNARRSAQPTRRRQAPKRQSTPIPLASKVATAKKAGGRTGSAKGKAATPAARTASAAKPRRTTSRSTAGKRRRSPS